MGALHDCRPGKHEGKGVADPTGFEPAISSVTGTYVRPLHHGSVKVDDAVSDHAGQGGADRFGRSGSGAWTRTRDHAINSRALYQLSYAGTFAEPGAGLEPATCGLQNRCSAS